MATTDLIGAQTRTRTTLHRVPLKPAMEFPAATGTVTVFVTPDTNYAPYSWSCTDCAEDSQAYAGLPFCRDDAKAHAETCTGPSATAPLPAPAREAMRRLEVALTTPNPAVVAKVHAVLGLKRVGQPRAYLGETATYMLVWSQIELNEIFERVGGTVTSREAKRSTSDGTWTATELTLTVDVDGVGPVELVTDIEDDPEHGYRTDVPVVAVARYGTAASRTNQLVGIAQTGNMSDLDADDLAHNVELMAGARATLAKLGRLDLIEAA
ncbi:hypothetical protein ACWD3J_14060 [Streptomyces sp. NPDC002755]